MILKIKGYRVWNLPCLNNTKLKILQIISNKSVFFFISNGQVIEHVIWFLTFTTNHLNPILRLDYLMYTKLSNVVLQILL